MATVSVAGHHVKVGPQNPERLVDHVTLPLLHHNLATLIIETVDFMEVKESLLLKSHLRDLGKERNLKFRDVSPGTDSCVEQNTEEEYGERNTKTEQQSNQIYLLCNRRDRHAIGSRLDQPVVRDIKLRSKLVFLAFLEQIDIKGFLDLLVSAHGLEFKGLSCGGG